MKPGDEVEFKGLKWTISSIWDTNVEGLRANLVRDDDTRKLGIDRCSAQVKELE